MADIKNKEIGASIKRSREEKGLTQEAFAALLELTPRMIQRYEDGNFPKYKKDKIVKIDQILGSNFYDIIYDNKLQSEGHGTAVAGISLLGLEPSEIPHTKLELGDINVTVADYIRLQDEFRKVQGDFLQSLLQKNEASSTSLDVQLGEIMKTMRIDHSQILKALDKVLALPPGSLSKENDKIKDAVDKKVKEKSSPKD